MAEEELDIKLPEDNREADKKTFTEEKREMSRSEKKLQKKQSEFEYREVEGLKGELEEEKKKSLREKILQWALIAIAAGFLIGLSFYLL